VARRRCRDRPLHPRECVSLGAGQHSHRQNRGASGQRFVVATWASLTTRWAIPTRRWIGGGGLRSSARRGRTSPIRDVNSCGRIRWRQTTRGRSRPDGDGGCLRVQMWALAAGHLRLLNSRWRRVERRSAMPRSRARVPLSARRCSCVALSLLPLSLVPLLPAVAPFLDTSYRSSPLVFALVAMALLQPGSTLFVTGASGPCPASRASLTGQASLGRT